MGMGQKHFLKNGKEYKGATHKTNGKLMSGKTHTSTSQPLFHMDKLSKAVQKKVKK